MKCHLFRAIGGIAGYITLALLAQVGMTSALSGQSVPDRALHSKRRSTLELPPPIRHRSLDNQRQTVRQAAYEESFANPIHRLPGSSEARDSSGFHKQYEPTVSGHPPAYQADGEVSESGWLLPSARWGLQPQGPTHAHPILRAPGIGKKSKAHGKTGPNGRALGGWVHPPFSAHRRRIQPAPPVLPGGRERQTWKEPYSYGYFGASGTRHWSLHHGYRDRYTQWSLK